MATREQLYWRNINRNFQWPFNDWILSTAIYTSTAVDYCCFSNINSSCSMFKAISCSYLSDFYWVGLKVCVALDVKSENITLEHSKVIGEYTFFLGLSCKFYWVFSCVTFAQKQIFKDDTNSKILYKHSSKYFFLKRNTYFCEAWSCTHFISYFLLDKPNQSKVIYHSTKRGKCISAELAFKVDDC